MKKYEEEMMMETKAHNKTGPAPWKERLWNEDGTALFMAVVAALLLLVFALSFSSLSNLEARIGINDYRARQAQMVAEAGFEAVRNHLRPVLTDYANFLGNTYTCNPGGCSCTDGANAVANGVPCTTAGIFAVSAGNFTIRVDNDLEDPGRVAVPETDTNGEAMLTALGRTGAGNGRAQARVQVILDDPFKHVCASDDVQADCANYQGDDPCTQAGILVQPCQPEDPHGPKVFPGLPVPTTIGISPLDVGRYGCINTPGTGWATRWTAEGNLGDPQVLGNADATKSYFDMALSTNAQEIEAAGWIPAAPLGRTRQAYCPACGINLPPAPASQLGCGLVIDGDWPSMGGGAATKHINTLATLAGESSSANTVVVYVSRRMAVANRVHIQGTVVVHGNATAGDFDIDLSPDFCLNRVSNGSDCGVPNTDPPNNVFPGAPGYPFAFVIWHPGNGAGDPPPQNTIAKISNTGIKVSGIIYSGGSVQFNPISVDGGVVAWDVEIQGNSLLVYNNAYGGAAKKGFAIPAGAYSAQFMRSTWLHCRATDADNVFTSPDIPATCN